MLNVQYISPDGQLIESFEMADGMTLHQAACSICPDTEGKFPAPVIALVGDKPAVRELGDWDFELYGANVQFRALAMGGGGGGGGSNPLQTVMALAIIALSIYASTQIPGLGIFAEGAALAGWGAFFGGLAGAGIIMLGTMLMGALFKQSLPSGQMASYDAAAASPTYSINSSGNQARLYQQEPEGFGRMKIVPDFVSNTWTQYVGNDQIGYFVYSIGRGLYEVESLQFGETVFWRDGHLIDSAYVDEGGAEYSTDINAELVSDAGYSDAFRATADNAEAKTIAITLTSPEGNSSAAAVQVQVQELSPSGTPVGDWHDCGTHTITEVKGQAFSQAISVQAPYYAGWQIRVANVGTTTKRIQLTKITSHAASIAWQIVEPGNAVSIFPDNVVTSTEVSGQELFAPNDEEFDGVLGPYTTNPAGTETDKLLFDFVLQQGIGYYDDQGRLQRYTVEWLIEYQLVDDFGNAQSDWATLEEISYSGATLTPQRITKEYVVTRGRYQVRVRRTSNTRGDGRTMDSLVWSALRAMLPGTLTYPQSCIAFSIKANNALTQNASRQFSIIATRKLPLYDRQTKTWSDPVSTRSWAAAVSHVCKSEWGGRITDDNFDLDTLWAIDERLQARGWYYDSYIDGPYLVWTLLCEMCQSQCVLPRFVGPYLSFVEDAPDRPPTFALTPRNIMRGTFAVNYVTWSDDTPDDVTLDYLDNAYGFQQRDVTATLPDSESREPASLAVLGITDRDHAHKVALRYACHNRYQRVIAECQVESMGRIINLGDVCTVAHPRFKNTAAGAVEGWNEAALQVMLTRDMTRLVPDGADESELYLALTRQDGSIWGPCKLAALSGQTATLDAGDYGTLLMQGQDNPFEWLTMGEDRLPSTWTLYTSRTYQRLMMVQSVTSQDALHYALKLGNYDPRMYRDDIPTPPWQGRAQLPTEEDMAAPGNLRGILQSDGSLLLVWNTVAGAVWYEVESSMDGSDWISQGRSNIAQMRLTVPSGPVHARVRAASETRQSQWSKWQGNISIPVPRTPSLKISSAYTGGKATITWTAVDYATAYTVMLAHDGQSFYTSTVTEPTFAVTPEIQTGGPFRSLSVSVVSVGVNGTSAAAILSLSDPAPVSITAIEKETGPDSITVLGISPAPTEDVTGYVLVKGESASFTADNILEMREVKTLPYTWGGLAAGKHYFRMAAKDALYDVQRALLTLNWSAVLTVEIEGAQNG